ncbi:MAG: ABC transporter ATP-binding protein [Bacteroidetes bacterium]|nr:ABC transporter ATP-binding protein [Bacteroidota bacterium]
MITLNDLTFRYSKKKPLFDHLSLELSPGHINGLLGKNGAGKTTLLKLVCGLCFPVEGSLKVGSHIPKERKPEFLQEVFFLPEVVYLPASSPAKLESMQAVFYPSFDPSRFREMLERFEVGWNEKLGQLSYGQKKKVMISFALACNTKYLLLDEPTNGLDIPSKASFRSILAGSFEENRIILISTHQVRDLQSLIDNILILDNGMIILDRSVEALAEQFSFGHTSGIPEAENAVYSGSGEMGRLFMALNTSGIPGHVDLETLFNAAISVPGIFTPSLTQTH